MDMLSIGYVHPLMVVTFCVWAIGRAAGAIAGEIDRGTMELLLAQPLARSRLILAHLLLDLVTIPILCLSLWAGNWLGAWIVSPIQIEAPKIKITAPSRQFLVELVPLQGAPGRSADAAHCGKPDPERMKKRLAIEPGGSAPPGAGRRADLRHLRLHDVAFVGGTVPLARAWGWQCF